MLICSLGLSESKLFFPPSHLEHLYVLFLTSLHHTLICLSLLCDLGLMSVVYHQYRTSDRAVVAGIFRAGEFRAAQIFTPGAKG